MIVKMVLAVAFAAVTGVVVVADAAGAANGTETFNLKDERGSAPWRVGFSKKEMVGEGVTGAVRRTVFAVPKDWAGKFVRFVIPFPMLNMDAVLFLNGERVGDILRPTGWLDVSRKLKFGEANEVSLYCTFTGEGTDYGKCPIEYDMRKVREFKMAKPPHFAVSEGPQILDVFANTSWRKKRVRCEVEVGAVEKVKVGDEGEQWMITVSIADQEGKVVKTEEKKVEVKPGVNHFAVEIPWDDPITWELGRPYLYTATVTLNSYPRLQPSTSTSQTVRFGFREAWREGKELYMNGHKLHLRTHYSFWVDKWGALFMRQIGYNCATYNHCVLPEGNFLGDRILDGLDEIGYGAIGSCGGLPMLCGWNFRTDEKRRAYVARFVQSFHRLTRNHPSYLGSYVTQMIVCDIGFGPDRIAMAHGGTDRHLLIDDVCDFHRKFNPNVLYYSHADGSCGDIASGNMYLNWTPLQERVEWLNTWAEKGQWPWHGAEFGQPNGGCWYAPRRLLCESEHLARYFGRAAYEQEPLEYLEGARAKGDTNPSGHGGKAPLAYGVHPLYWELQKLWCWQTNSRWRGNGHNGGNNYFNLGDAYGTPPDEKDGHSRYGVPSMALVAGRRPDWVNANFDNYALGNKDFLGYIGGCPHHTDMTHTWYSDERVDKQAVLLWDGLGEKRVSGSWRLASRDLSTTYASGCFDRILRQGEVVKVPFAFTAPSVTRKTDACLVLNLSDGAEPLWTDSLDVSFYPRERTAVSVPGKRPVALFDTTGEGAAVLDALNVAYVKLGSLDELGTCERLVIGKNALGETDLLPLADRVSKGLRILILPQEPATWQALGFDVQDSMARILFAYDPSGHSPCRGLSNDMLRYWRGAPRYGKSPSGAIMTHAGSRGPRGSRNHVVAGLTLRVPDRVGYLPLIAGEFDMNYAALLRFNAGTGGIWYCTLDFEERVAVDPAATIVAQRVFSDFLSGPLPKSCDAAVADEIRLIAKKGFFTDDGRIYRAEPLPGLGPELFRWTCPVVARRDADNSFMLRRDQFRGQIGDVQAVKTNMAPSWAQMHVNRLFCRQATLTGVQPSPEDIRKALYQSVTQPFVPFPAMHVLGPFASGVDNGEYQMETVWNRQVEEMAVAGDFNPNFEFPLPQGGTANWRPLVYPGDDGRFDLGPLYPGVSFPVCYAIAEVEREQEGEAKILCGFDWQAKVWVNGERVPFEGRRKYGSGQGPYHQLKVHLKAGKNIISIKAGAGRSAFKFWALIENESKGAAAKRQRDDTLERRSLYEDLVPDHDPNVFVWW